MHYGKIIVALFAILIVGAGIIYITLQKGQGNEPAEDSYKKYTIKYGSFEAKKEMWLGQTKEGNPCICNREKVTLGNASRFVLLKVLPEADGTKEPEFTHNAELSTLKEGVVFKFSPKTDNLTVETEYYDNLKTAPVNIILTKEFMDSLSAEQNVLLTKKLAEISSMDLNKDSANKLENYLGEELVKAMSGNPDSAS